MTQDTQECLDIIMAMSLADAQHYLLTILEQGPEVFKAIHFAIEELQYLDELRNEEHNGFKMYPELQ